VNNPPKQSRHLMLLCDHCSNLAAEISLLPENIASKDLWLTRDRLERAEFLGKLAHYGRYAQLEDIFEALRQADYTTARQIAPAFCAFICAGCAASYCEVCWAAHPRGDTVYGRCPNGHGQELGEGWS
jgi:hypothetical protein